MLAAELAMAPPIPLALAKPLLVAAFLLHIVFVNLMVGGTLVTLHCHWRGRRDPALLAFAKELLDTVTVHKSLAVVLGVAPLLLVSVAYTGPFFTSSTLIAPAWLSVLWLVTLAFGALYVYRYGWTTWRLRHPWAHAASGLLAALCLLTVPLIYLTNTNLMLAPEAWAAQPGFFTALWHVGNVGPRYLHFMLASLAVTGFWIALWWSRASATERLGPEAQARILHTGIMWALVPTALQFAAGPLVLFSLPSGGITPLMIGVLAFGVLAGALSLFAMIDSLRGPSRMPRAALLLLATIVCMGTARHLVREALLNRPSKPSASAETHAKMVHVTNNEEGGPTHGNRRTADDDGPATHGGGHLPDPA